MNDEPEADGDPDERRELTPLGLLSTRWNAHHCAEILALLEKHARFGAQPGEVGVIVFPAEGEPFFENAEDPAMTIASGEVHASGNGDAHYPAMLIGEGEAKGGA